MHEFQGFSTPKYNYLLVLFFHKLFKNSRKCRLIQVDKSRLVGEHQVGERSVLHWGVVTISWIIQLSGIITLYAFKNVNSVICLWTQ